MAIIDRSDGIFKAFPMAMFEGYKGGPQEGGMNYPGKSKENSLETTMHNPLNKMPGITKNIVVVFKDCSFTNSHFHFGDR